MLKKCLLVSFCVFAFSPESVFAMNPDMSKDRGGATTLTCKFGRVERAGVAIVKDYGTTTQVPALRFAVIVGQDARKSTPQRPYVNFFGGGCEKNDGYSTVTAVQELREETGKGIQLHSNALQAGKDVNYFGYAYSGDFAATNTKGKNYNQLFFYRKDDASVNAIETAMATAAKDPNLSHRFKETNGAYAIPLQDILDRARLIYKLETAGQHVQVQADGKYMFKTRGKGDGTGRTDIYLDPQYMRNLARDIARDPNNLPTICNKISGGFVK